jgi:D-alanyl-D-alanine carboxypeptidase (penicillin-binding protein 5/6)
MLVRRVLTRLLGSTGALLIVLAVLCRPALAFDTDARAAILVDVETGRVLYEQNADEPLPPASMSKLMTVTMVFERLRDGTLTLETELPVSKKAWQKGGSKMFVEVGDRVSVDDLLHGIIVQSGNDACIVVAEALAGTEEAFAAQMTERAKALGLTHATFKNASGWPDPGHLVSVRDLATLATYIITEFPEHYHYFGTREFTYQGIRQYARNPLLRQDLGVDGMKTGYTREAGYGLVASAERDGRRLVAVVAGLEKPSQRASQSAALLEYGFRNFENYALFEQGQPVEEADVWLGDTGRVPLVPEEDVVVTLSREARRQLEVRLVYDNPVPAPVRPGSELAYLQITAPGIESRTVPLVAAHEVHAASMFGRVKSALGYLIFGAS